MSATDNYDTLNCNCYM